MSIDIKKIAVFGLSFSKGFDPTKAEDAKAPGGQLAPIDTDGPLLVSACLPGQACRYDGKALPCADVERLATASLLAQAGISVISEADLRFA